jgi:hypothetical protein
MAFKSTAKPRLNIESPESLFWDIKTRKIPGLLTQQGDVLREYVADYVDAKDIAVQLPTGSGKTLVALLIAEWRRLTKKERVVFLCPTNQLVHQVADQARNKYGLDVITFTGSVKNYPTADTVRYNSSQSIAVTSYSALFNSNPFFTDAHTIILDDSHAAEQYVASNWTIELCKREKDNQVLFNALASALRPLVDELTHSRLISPPDSSAEFQWVEKVPAERVLESSVELDRVIDEHVEGTPARYAWRALKGHLHACNIFLAHESILIRPYLAPTFSHAPFEQATQRIYLSATPGDGGELERIFCRKKIDRLTPPAGSDKHSVGRRFFIFPELKLSNEEQIALLLKLAEKNRMLVLAGDNSTAGKIRNIFEENIDARIFTARDIEASKEEFVKSCPAVAILANRYDGIDFPEDECRQTVLVDIPTTTNLQEKFLISRLAAARVFDARLLTRVIQSFGRCTRSATDFGIIVIFGDRLVSYLSKKDRQSYFHPELQAELVFGLNESAENGLTDTLENIDLFLNQSDEWKGAEAQIYELRDEAEQAILPGSETLAGMVRHEVDYTEKLWNRDLSTALQCCQSILGGLTDASLRGSRAIWNYFAGSIASQLSKDGVAGMGVRTREYYEAAAKSVPSLSWLYSLNNDNPDAISASCSPSEAAQLDGLERVLVSLGIMHDRNYDKEEAAIRKGILSEEAFEQAHEQLGSFLGFSGGKIESSGSPDPWWALEDHAVLVFEDHAGALPTSKLSITKARQAATHENWIRENLSIRKNIPVIQILITPVTKTESGALCHLQNVKVWMLADFRDWVEKALSILRELRGSFSEPGDVEWRSKAIDLLRRNGLTADSIVESLQDGTNVLSE